MTLPPLYRNLVERDLRGTICLLGGPDSGKSTLARVLWQALAHRHAVAALLDTDPGQTATGPPTTQTLTVRQRTPWGVELHRTRYFVGNTSPRGHMLPMLAGTARLYDRAREVGASFILIDTCGLVSREGGGVVLKNHKIEWIRPDWIIALQREDELERILQGWEGHPRIRVLRARVPEEVQTKSPAFRRARRNARFQAYFAHAPVRALPVQGRRAFFYHSLQTGRLLALLDEEDFLLGLAILVSWHPGHRLLEVRTPVSEACPVSAVRTGRLLLNPLTGEEVPPPGALSRAGHVQRPSITSEEPHETPDGVPGRPSPDL